MALGQMQLFSNALSRRVTFSFYLPDLDRFEPPDSAWGHAESAVSREDRPPITFDCGVDDELLEGNRAFHAHLERLGYPHDYLDLPGAHTWEYWDEHVQEALPKHMERLMRG